MTTKAGEFAQSREVSGPATRVAALSPSGMVHFAVLNAHPRIGKFISAFVRIVLLRTADDIGNLAP